jgi:tyrosyl-tRNA synthetase
MLPAWDYWQFWRNTEDADVGRFLRLFTDLPDAQIAELERLQGAELNEAKKVLATEATRLCRGDAAAEGAAETARATFEAGEAGAGLPTVEVPRAAFEAGISIVDLLVQAGLSTSRGEARRLVAGGGARVNDAPVTEEHARFGLDALPGGQLKLSAGRKRHALVRAV